MYEIELIDKIEDFLKIKDEWNYLLKKTDTNVLYLTHEWLAAWWECFGDQKRLAVLLVRNQGELCAAAPLMLTRKKKFFLNLICLRFIGNSLCYRLNFLIPDDHEKLLSLILDYIINRIKWHIAEFYHIPVDSAVYKAFINLLSKKNSIFCSEDMSLLSPYIPVNEPWDSYLKHLSKSFVRTLQKKKRRLEKIGYSVLSSRGGAAYPLTQSLLEDTFKIAEKTWQHKAGTSIASDEKERRFFTLIAEQFNEYKGLYLYILRIGDDNAAFDYSIKYTNILYTLKKGYDPKYQKFSPGVILDSIQYENFFREDCREIDMGGHINRDKLSWTSHVRRHNVVYLFRRRLFHLYFWPFILKPFLRRFKILRKFKSLIIRGK